MAFDPYYTWLGISPKDQPPNHYRLLGIDLFESNADVIDHAADRQMSHIRSFQTGPNSAHSQRILNEISKARVCLLNSDKREQYDQPLRAKQQEESQPATSQPIVLEESDPEDPLLADLADLEQSATSTLNSLSTRKKEEPIWNHPATIPVTIAAGVVLLLLIVIGLSIRSAGLATTAKHEAEQLAVEKAAADKHEAERLAAKKTAAAKREAEQLVTEKAAADNVFLDLDVDDVMKEVFSDSTKERGSPSESKRKGRNIIPGAAKDQAAGGQRAIQLFNGETLENWTLTAFEGRGRVHVANSALILERGRNSTGVTWKGQSLPRENYEISLEAKRLNGNDFFCGLTFPVKQEHCTLIVGGWGGEVVGLSTVDGLDAAYNATTSRQSFEIDRWYKVRLRVTSDLITAWLNGKQVLKQKITRHRFSLRPEIESAKPFGLTAWKTGAAFRNVRVQPVDSLKPGAAKDQAAGEQRPREQAGKVIEGNVALSSNGTVAVGAYRDEKNMLDGKMDRKYAKLGIGNPCLIILAEKYRLSKIRFKVVNVGKRYYQYTLEVSPDGRSYEMIADRRKGQHRGWQTYNFPSRPVGFIRLSGTHVSDGDALYVHEFEAYCHTTQGAEKPQGPSH